MPNEGIHGRDWLEAELLDSLDEEAELELEDATLSLEIARICKERHPDQIDRKVYFRELLRLQAELIKLQDWVVRHKQKVVVVFEGRDSAGKGSAIKRITQRLNPRVARVVALPAPSATARRPSGTSSATCRTCRRAARSCCSTAPGTTAPASSA